MPREATLFEQTGGSPVRAYLALLRDGGNIPPNWIDRARESRKNREKALVETLQEGGVSGLLDLEDWELAYRKECFYRGIRALMELQRDGKTKL
jgi:hypothetical protein